MLLKFLSTIFITLSLIISAKLIYDSTIFLFWSSEWITGTIFSLLFSAIGVFALINDSSDKGYKALAVVSYVYFLSALIIYGFWGYRHIGYTLELSDYLGFALLFTVVVSIAFAGLYIYSQEESTMNEVFAIPAWTFAVVNVGMIIFVTSKYVFNSSDWNFLPFIGEIIIIFMGALIFIASHKISENKT